jgi:hypothetical protein
MCGATVKLCQFFTSPSYLPSSQKLIQYTTLNIAYYASAKQASFQLRLLQCRVVLILTELEALQPLTANVV